MAAARDWIDAIKSRSADFPRLNGLLYLREESEKREEMPWLKWFLIGAGGVAGGGAAWGVSQAWKQLARSRGWKEKEPKPISRRELFKKAALRTAALLVGRSADHASTYAFLSQAHEGLERIRNSREFKLLPPQVRNMLLPPIENLEGQTHYRGLVREYPKKPYRAATDALLTALAASGIVHATGLRRRWVPSVGTAAVTIGSFIATAYNLHGRQAMKKFFGLEALGELRLLHARMAARERLR